MFSEEVRPAGEMRMQYQRVRNACNVRKKAASMKTKRRQQAASLICETGSTATRRCYPAVLRGDEILENTNVLCLPAFSSFGHAEFNRLAFLQTAVSAALNRREMHKDILSTLTRDKTKAFVGVEPLNCSLFHYVFSYLLI